MKSVCVFSCSTNTFHECLEKSLFASNKPWPLAVTTGTPCYLFHYDTGTFFGVWETASAPAINIDAKAWRGKFPYQVKVKLVSSEMVELPKELSIELKVALMNGPEGLVSISD